MDYPVKVIYKFLKKYVFEQRNEVKTLSASLRVSNRNTSLRDNTELSIKLSELHDAEKLFIKIKAKLILDPNSQVVIKDPKIERLFANYVCDREDEFKFYGDEDGIPNESGD